jgi:hypothetical protein
VLTFLPLVLTFLLLVLTFLPLVLAFALLALTFALLVLTFALLALTFLPLVLLIPGCDRPTGADDRCLSCFSVARPSDFRDEAMALDSAVRRAGPRSALRYTFPLLSAISLLRLASKFASRTAALVRKSLGLTRPVLLPTVLLPPAMLRPALTGLASLGSRPARGARG